MEIVAEAPLNAPLHRTRCCCGFQGDVEYSRTRKYWRCLVVWTTDKGYGSVRRHRLSGRQYVLSNADKELKLDLECLRLASDLIQMSRDTLDPDLRAHFIRMAAYWSGHEHRDSKENPASQDNQG